MAKKNEVDNKWEFLDKLLGYTRKHWWKVVLILLAAGVAFSGWKCPTPWGTIEKTKVYERERREGKYNYPSGPVMDPRGY
ncbi:MAG: hypothetical protein CVV44_20410 [Spirochaetae bacterium HGW-Spirochaetae-1]|nr:MAG: hypothetical protein CVV44_20410 [Spirochaetae bacterium HGW-Spirochaetae-1]